jgi:uncharacterized protein YjbI with pentapeptide repeats
MRRSLRAALSRAHLLGGLLALALAFAWLLTGPSARTSLLHRFGIRHVPEGDLSGADLAEAELADVHFGAGTLQGTDLRGADLASSTFVEADLQGARLDGADLRQANLIDADLRRASLVGARLDHAWLSGSNLRGANLEGASLRGAWLLGADLRESVGLQQTQLDGACGDETTQLPDGLQISACD